MKPSFARTSAALALVISALTPSTSFAETFRFQQDLDGYSGTQDSEIKKPFPSQNYGTSTRTNVSGITTQYLIRFENIFGDAPGQIGSNWTITSATLSFYNKAVVGGAVNLHDMLIDWSESSVTWNSVVNGIQADGVDASVTPIAVLAAGSSASFDVTESLRSVQSGTLAGYGWVLLGTSSASNISLIYSSEFERQTYRPILTVNVAPAVPEPDTYAMMVAGLATLGTLIRRRYNQLAQG